MKQDVKFDPKDFCILSNEPAKIMVLALLEDLGFEEIHPGLLKAGILNIEYDTDSHVFDPSVFAQGDFGERVSEVLFNLSLEDVEDPMKRALIVFNEIKTAIRILVPLKGF